MNLTYFIEGTPYIYKDFYKRFFNSPERLDYHPEGTLGAHINITINRAFKSKDINLMLIAALHDICKGMQPKKSKGGLKTIKMANGKSCTYHSNPDHAYQAGAFIRDNESIQFWISQLGGDIDIVTKVCEMHMKHKSYTQGVKGIKGGMKESKRKVYKDSLSNYEFLYLQEFSKIDNMLEEYLVNEDIFPIFTL